MSSHEDLNEQWRAAVERDNARDSRGTRRQPLSRSEQERGIAAVSKWPKERRDELFEMETNERNMMLLLAGELGAVPE